MRFALVVAGFLCVGSMPLVAQYSVDKVVIRGGAPYTDAELLDVAGLHAGQFLTHNSLQSAAQHLLDTGVFDDAEVSLSGEGKARTVNFVLKTTPLAKMMPASFANMVWWTPEELANGIHASVSLYRGRLPEAGNLPDGVQNALVKMLAGKGVTATVSHATVEPTTQHPVRVVDFRVETPMVRLQSVALGGVPSELAAETQKLVGRVSGSAYNEGWSGDTVEDRLLGPVRGAGYITATLIDVKREPQSGPKGIGVTYSARMQAGEVYKVSAISWSTTPVYSAQDFARDSKLHVGDVASGRALGATEASVAAAYRTKGYLDAFVESSPKIDSATHTVAYALSVQPGEQYRVKTVTPVNLSGEALRVYEAGWRLKPNDIYDANYVETFLTKDPAFRSLAGYTAGFQLSADPTTHLVDLVINFVGR